MLRSEIRWRRWDAAMAAGERPADFLPHLSDDDLIQLLATSDGSHRRFDCSLIATELHNRLSRLRAALGEVAQAADHHIDAAISEGEEATEAIHRTVDSVTSHVRARQDAIADEPETAQAAGAATRRVREALGEVDETKERLLTLADAAREGAEPEA